MVYHQPSPASGGVVSEIAVDVFLSHAEQGPEYQALSAALAELKLSDKHSDDSELTQQSPRRWIGLWDKLL